MQRIINAKTAWDILTKIFKRKNEATLKRLENELLSRNMTISLCLSKVRSLYDEILKLDPEKLVRSLYDEILKLDPEKLSLRQEL